MATKKVNIDIIARDKSQRALQGVRGSLDKVKASVFNVRNALAGLGAGLAIRSLVNTGKEIESLQVRLKFLFGTAEEGAKAFDNMAKFASKVPFSLEQIQQGAGVLSVVSKDADELSDIMEITGNVAAVTGLDFRTASEQIQRSLSAGIASADLFREKGVRDLLGFKAGATVTAEETAEAFKRVFGKGGQFGGATDELAKTFEGTLSMIGDKFFNFKKTILEAGFFPELKKQFGDLDDFLEENGETIDEIATKIGKGLAQATKTTANSVKFLSDNFETLKGILTTIIALKVASFFYGIATAVGAANMALVTFNRTAFITKGRLGILTSLMALANGEFGLMAKLEQDKADATEKDSKESSKLTEHMKKANEVVKQNNEENTKAIDIIKEYKNGLVDLNIQQARMEDVQTGMSDKDKDLVKEHTKFLNLQKETLSTINDHMRVRNKLTAEQAGLFTVDKIVEELKKEEEQLKKTMQVYAEFAMQRGRLSLQASREEREQAKNNQHKMFDDALEFNHKKAQLEKQAKEHAISEGRSALQILAGMNRTAFAAFKAVRIAEATIDTYRAATAAFAKFGGFPLGAIAAAASVAKGLALVAQIKSTNFRAGGGSVNKDQAYMVGEKGPEMFVPSGSGKIVPNNQISNAQPVNVNFNINTVDARGFNELLVNSRGLIVNMINSAVNEKGRQALV
jgi:hypothetical protein